MRIAQSSSLSDGCYHRWRYAAYCWHNCYVVHAALLTTCRGAIVGLQGCQLVLAATEVRSVAVLIAPPKLYPSDMGTRLGFNALCSGAAFASLRRSIRWLRPRELMPNLEG